MYSFYFDESYHDRRVSFKDDTLNIYRSNSSDSFTYCFIGIDYSNSKQDSIKNKFLSIEKQLKNILGLEVNQELKGKTINKKFYRHGFSSFREEHVWFYNQIFKTLNKSNALMHIGTLSKTEYMIDQVITKWFEMNNQLINDFGVYVNSAKYTLVKLIYNHREDRIIKEIFNNPTAINLFNLKQYLIQLIEGLIKVNEDNLRTKEQSESFEAVLKYLPFLETGSKLISINDSFDYSQVFKGFSLFIEEKHIKKKDITVHIDNERKIEKCAIDHSFKVGLETESKNYIFLRVCDFVANLFGRLIKEIEDHFKEPPIFSIKDLDGKLYKNKRELPKEWFELKAKQFKLYKNLNDYLVQLACYRVIFTGRYSDSVIILTSLIQYIGHEYNNYNEFNVISAVKHQKRFNDYYMRRLIKHFYKLYMADMAKRAIENE